MQVHHDVVVALRIERSERCMHAVRAAWQRRIGQHRKAAVGVDCFGDFGIATGDGDRSDLRLTRAIQHVDDHRLAVDVGERLAGQPALGASGFRSKVSMCVGPPPRRM